MSHINRKSVLFRIDPWRFRKFEKSLNLRGVEWSLVPGTGPEENETVYEVTGEVESLDRLSRESMVISVEMRVDNPIPYGAQGQTKKEGSRSQDRHR